MNGDTLRIFILTSPTLNLPDNKTDTQSKNVLLKIPELVSVSPTKAMSYTKEATCFNCDLEQESNSFPFI